MSENRALTIDYEAGISAIDSGYVRPMFDAIHLVVEQGRAALVDTASAHSLPRVVDALASKGLDADAVDWIILTHVHLDHAGGAGAFMRHFPRARLAVHPRGARHMADPTRLIEGTIAVYGEKLTRRLYGEIVPVGANRIQEMPDRSTLFLGGRELLFLDTPGHARHHVCVVDSRTRHIFAGDSFGLSYREFDDGAKQFVFPSCAPVQFDPDAFHRTLDVLAGFNPPAIYVTHYSQVRDVPRLAADMHRLVDEFAALGLLCAGEGKTRLQSLEAGMKQLVVKEARGQGWNATPERALELLDADIRLNGQGLESWLESRAKSGA